MKQKNAMAGDHGVLRRYKREVGFGLLKKSLPRSARKANVQARKNSTPLQQPQPVQMHTQ